MAIDVKCEVKSCVFNQAGQLCGAEEIFVVKHSENPKTSEDTDCKTFEAR